MQASNHQSEEYGVEIIEEEEDDYSDVMNELTNDMEMTHEDKLL